MTHDSTEGFMTVRICQLPVHRTTAFPKTGECCLRKHEPSYKERTSENYFLAGRRLIWPVIGASLFASNIGTEHLVGLAGDAHRVGLVAGGFEWMACFCLLILAVVFVPQYLRTRIYTIPEFLERRFSLTARQPRSPLVTCDSSSDEREPDYHGSRMDAGDLGLWNKLNTLF